MDLPNLYLSRPAIHLPGIKVTNDDLIADLRANFSGADDEWELIESQTRAIFDRCGSSERYIENDPNVRVGDIGARAARACMEKNDLQPGDIDLLIHGAVAREYFEPSTAMEVAAKSGIERVHAFDVTSACVGHLESVHTAAGLLAINPSMSTAMLVSGELTRQFLSRKICSLAEFRTKAAGLTIGNAAAAWALGRRPFPGGSVRIRKMATTSLPEHWELCQAPIDGTFASLSTELFKLNVHVPNVISGVLGSIGLSAKDIDHFVFHQPSDLMVDKVIVDLGVDPQRALKTHGKYGNTVSTSVALCLHELVESDLLADGDRLVFCSAAAGFTIVTLVGEWEKSRDDATN